MPHKVVFRLAASTVDWTVIASGLVGILEPVFGAHLVNTGSMMAGFAALLIGVGRFIVFVATARKSTVETRQMEERVDRESVGRLEELACRNAPACETRRGIHLNNQEEE